MSQSGSRSQRRTSKAKSAAAAKPAAVVAQPVVVKKYPKEVVDEALQTTFWLQGNLKSTRMAYLRVAKKLARVRDGKLYEALGHPDIQDYAWRRLHLGRSSMGQYLRIHDWAKKRHPEWLEDKVKGFLPDFSDIGDLMWIEEELERTDLSPARRTALEDLQKKGMAGELRQAEMRKFRKRENTADNSLKNMISKFRLLRKRAAALKNIPSEAIEHLDAAIKILVNEKALQVAFLSPLPPSYGESRQKYFA